MEDRIYKLSNELGIPVKKIFDFFYYLKDGQKVDNYELIRMTGIAKNSINTIKESFKDLFGKSSTTTQIDIVKAEHLDKMFDSDFSPDEDLLNLSLNRELIEFLIKRVSPLREFDQFTATPETVLKRASILQHLADIKEKRLLFLGDDDFTSVAVAMTQKAREIVVLDIDERILGEIREISTKKSLGITTIKHDLRKTLPKDMCDKFGIVFTDPPYTSEGMRLFISRAISALDYKNKTARIYVCYGNSDRAKERFLPIFRTIIDSGLMFRYVFDKFNRYFGAESIGSSSSLYVLDATPKAKALIKGDYDKPIYTND